VLAARYAPDVETAGKLLLLAAATLAVVGIVALVLARLGITRLPGTLSWHPSANSTVIVPIGLMVVVSIVGSILLNLFFRK
jgi:hypothetical protein